jgi:general secretion pathway protein A
MYESYYGLSSLPFRLNPDPAFLFESLGHRRALANLEYGIHKREGFIVVTGDVGTGKTTLVQHLLQKLPPEQIVAAQVVSTLFDPEDVLRLVATSFGVEAAGADKPGVLNALIHYFVALHAQGKRALLIVDEAQNLSVSAIEELRMLSNYQIGNESLLQTFLMGQPEFRNTIDSPALRQFRQRVLATYHLGPLAPAEIRSYIEHRLRLAGWSNHPNIEDDAFEAVYANSDGVPRRINALFDRVLLAGFLNEQAVIKAPDVNEVGSEMLPAFSDHSHIVTKTQHGGSQFEQSLARISQQLDSIQIAVQQLQSERKQS